MKVEDVRNQFDYNPETGVFTNKLATCRRPAGAVVGYLHSNGYRRLTLKGKTILEHRAAWAHYYGVDPPGQIDHINRDTTDNRIENLRATENVDNARNCSRSKHNTSGVNGVSLNKSKGKYKAKIHVNGKSIFLGWFTHKWEAALARAKANVRYGFDPCHGFHRPLDE